LPIPLLPLLGLNKKDQNYVETVPDFWYQGFTSHKNIGSEQGYVYCQAVWKIYFIHFQIVQKNIKTAALFCTACSLHATNEVCLK
jgi:hypothetical protein